MQQVFAKRYSRIRSIMTLFWGSLYPKLSNKNKAKFDACRGNLNKRPQSLLQPTCRSSQHAQSPARKLHSWKLWPAARKMTPSQTVAALSGTVPASAAPVPVTEEWFCWALALPNLKLSVHFSCPIKSERFKTWIAHDYVQNKPSNRRIRVGQLTPIWRHVSLATFPSSKPIRAGAASYRLG
jgi:hypothetical protein